MIGNGTKYDLWQLRIKWIYVTGRKTRINVSGRRCIYM